MNILLTLSFLTWVAVCLGLPRIKHEISMKSNAASLTSQIIATNLLKDNIDNEGNHVFSPLGISSMLAILAEGAKGDTYNEFVSALKFPQADNKMDLRESFKMVLGNLYKKNLDANPSFRTWFYVYRNNTARDEFKKILRDYYLVDVKDIDRDSSNIMELSTTSSGTNSKDIIEFETLKKSQTLPETTSDQSENQKDASKFDKVVDDKQYVEVPVIKEEIANEMMMMTVAVKDGDRKPNEQDLPESIPVKIDSSTTLELNIEDNETVKDEEKLDTLRKNVDSTKITVVNESNEPEKITIPLKKLEDPEIMQTLESHFITKRFSEERSMFQKDDVASALSANTIVSRKDPLQTKMLLFNGLYYRGNWAYPFQELRSGNDDRFYVNNEKSIPVTMMKARGMYRTANMEEIQSQIIELPYEDKRYAFYAIIPNQKDGLKDLIKAIKPEFYEAAKSRLTENFISLCLPKFSIEQTCRSEATIQRLGLKKLFTKSADLSGISEDIDLHVEGLVQHVNVKVDEGAMEENVLSAAAQSRSVMTEEDKKIVVDRPFLYFVVDRETAFVIIAGKVTEPKFGDNLLDTNM